MLIPVYNRHLQESPRRKLFLLMVLVIGGLIVGGFILMLKSLDRPGTPEVPPPRTISLLTPQSTSSPA